MAEEQKLPEEQAEQTPQEEETPEDEQLVKDSEAIAEFLDEPVEEPEDEPEEKPEEPEEEPEEEVPEPVQREDFERFKEEIFEAIGAGDKAKEEIEESGFKFAWEERGEEKPASWEEQAKETVRLYKHMESQEQEKVAEAEKEKAAELAERQKAINTEWDNQIDYLVQSGEIPSPSEEVQKKLSEGKTLTKAEREDPGMKARAEIFEKMYEVGIEAEEQGRTAISDVVHIYNRFVKPNKSKKPAGAKAPVSGGSRAVSQPTEDDMSWDELNKSNFEDLI